MQAHAVHAGKSDPVVLILRCPLKECNMLFDMTVGDHAKQMAPFVEPPERSEDCLSYSTKIAIRSHLLVKCISQPWIRKSSQSKSFLMLEHFLMVQQNLSVVL